MIKDKENFEKYLLKISNEYRESQFDQISIGKKTKTEAITAALHCQAGYMAGYRRALKDISENKKIKI